VLTRYLAKELARAGSRRMCGPGAIQTDFSGGMVRDNPEITGAVAEMTALGRAGVRRISTDDRGPFRKRIAGSMARE